MDDKTKYNLIAVGKNSYQMIHDMTLAKKHITRVCFCNLSSLSFWDTVDHLFKSDIFKNINDETTVKKIEINPAVISNISVAPKYLKTTRWKFIDISDNDESKTSTIFTNAVANFIKEDVLTILIADISELTGSLTEQVKKLPHLTCLNRI
ncbi:MAG: hypothetical protein GXO47_14025 [Chlorobi bacterium]|nr:hypothetical protein [Chlorobiota bacterium]